MEQRYIPESVEIPGGSPVKCKVQGAKCNILDFALFVLDITLFNLLLSLSPASLTTNALLKIAEKHY